MNANFHIVLQNCIRYRKSAMLRAHELKAVGADAVFIEREVQIAKRASRLYVRCFKILCKHFDYSIF